MRPRTFRVGAPAGPINWQLIFTPSSEVAAPALAAGALASLRVTLESEGGSVQAAANAPREADGKRRVSTEVITLVLNCPGVTCQTTAFSPIRGITSSAATALAMTEK